MKTQIVTGPAYAPVSLDQVKGHLRVTSTSEDWYIRGLIYAAIGMVEQIIRRKLTTQTWKLFLEAWPIRWFITIPFGKLQSVTHIKYTDSDSTQTTWDSGEYIVDVSSDPGRVVLGYGESWPSATLYPSNPIEIQFVCGYGVHAPLTITAASNASPIVVTSAGHGLSSSDHVYIEGVTGNTNANGSWKIEYVSVDTFSLTGSAGNAAYVSGGTAVKLDVPDSIIHAIEIIVSDLYENREGISGLQHNTYNIVKALLTPYKLYNLGA